MTLTTRQEKAFYEGLDRIYKYCLSKKMAAENSPEQIIDMIFDEFGNGNGCVAIGTKIAKDLK